MKQSYSKGVNPQTALCRELKMQINIRQYILPSWLLVESPYKTTGPWIMVEFSLCRSGVCEGGFECQAFYKV